MGNLFGLLLAWPNAATLTAFLVAEAFMQVIVSLEASHFGRMLGDE
ncbi:MAG: hypothetical protein Q8L66_02390 [Caulobacter sp.]|nr:hypothetical protein [Caulobacter sp.]